jgi:hypothetical protein
MPDSVDSKPAPKADLRHGADPEWREAISPNGVKYFVSRFAAPRKQPRKQAPPLIPDDLSIPAYLHRLLMESDLRLAA